MLFNALFRLNVYTIVVGLVVTYQHVKYGFMSPSFTMTIKMSVKLVHVRMTVCVCVCVNLC